MAASSHFGKGTVRAARDVAADVRMIEIEPAGEALSYPTGAHLDIAVVIDELPDIRSYSLVGERPVDGAYRIAVKDVGAGGAGPASGAGPGPGARARTPPPRTPSGPRTGGPG